jgi:hypothetical protein
LQKSKRRKNWHLKLNTTITEGLIAPRANSKNILIYSQFYANNKVGLNIIIYNEDDSKHFNNLLGVPEVNDSGF